MKLFKRKQKIEGVEEVPSAHPITPSGVEKFVLTNGREVLLYRPRVSNDLNGSKANGEEMNEDGSHMHRFTIVDLSTVQRRVAMGWSRSLVQLVEQPDWPLPSEE